jgi:dihydroorotate dehydrogenase (NAD+) catalytic subunit
MAFSLKTTVGTLEMNGPIMAASGCYGYGIEYRDVADPSHLGAFVTKSISLERWKGNPPPRLAEVGPGLINSIGLANMGVDSFLREIGPQLPDLGTKVVVSVACKVMEEYAQVVERLEECTAIDGYELNISCPNVKEGGMAFSQNPRVTEQLVSSVRKVTGKWFTSKLTPNVASVQDGARAAEAGGSDAVSLINTLVGMAVDWKTQRPRVATITGGYSGPPIKPVALAKVWEAYNAVKIPIIGMGGIVSWTDVLEFMIVGASAVQIGTALYADPQISQKLNEELIKYGTEHSLSSLSEIVGSLKTDRAAMVGVPS